MRRRFLSPVVLGLVVRPLLRERIRTLLTILGIAVGVAVLVAIQLSNQSALRAFGESVDAIAGRANYQLASDGGNLNETLLLKLQPYWGDGVRFAPVIDTDAYIQPNDVPIRILGVDLFSDLHFRDYRYASIATSETNAANEAAIAQTFELFREDSIVVPQQLAQEHGWKIGSRVTLRSGGRDALFVVRGILKPEGPATAFNGSLAIVDIAAAQRALQMGGQLSRVDLMIPEAVAPRIVRELGRAMPKNVRIERPSRRNERVGKMLRAFRVNLFALAAVALLVGVFLVYNTVLISILRRRRDVGIVKTLGVSPPQIFFAFLGEGAIFGVVGSIVGIALGYLLAFGTLDLIGKTINALYVQSAPQQIDLTPTIALSAIALGTVVSLLASIQPALEASAVRPSALIRPGIYQRIRASRVRTLLIFSASSALIAFVLARMPAVNGLPLFGYLSVVFVVAAVSLISPVILSILATALRRPLRALFRLSGRLASSGVTASLRRTSVATAALAIAVGMMVAVAVMVGSFRETVRIWVDQTVSSDLWLRPARGLANAPYAVFQPEISNALKGIEFIEAFDRFRGRDMVFRDSMIAVGSSDFDVVVGHSTLPMIEPSSARAAVAEARGVGGVLVSESFSIKYGLGRGDRLTLPVLSGERAFPITGVYRDYSNDRGVVVMDRNLYARMFGDDQINTIAVYLKPGVSPDFARAEIERRLGARFKLFAFTNVTIRTEVMRIFDQTFLITYALLAVALAVAVLGIINTLSALILERRRELALLRVLGMSVGQVRGMIVLESAIIGLTAILLGAITGWLLSYILIFVINKQSFGWTIQMAPPGTLIAVSLLITFVTTVITGIFPSRVAARLQLSAELKGE